MKSGSLHSSIQEQRQNNAALGDYGSRAGDSVGLGWAISNYKEANGLQQSGDHEYELGAAMYNTGTSFTLGQTHMGTSDSVYIGDLSIGDALVHSHGHYGSPEDLVQHVGLLKAWLSAVFTLADGYLWVQCAI